MSLGKSNMAGAAVGAAVCLLWASITQGVEMSGHEAKEAVEGQNVTLRCIVESPGPVLKLVSMEWIKVNNKNAKLALYSSGYGFNLFWTNVTMTLDDKDPAKAFGSYLHLPAVRTWDSGTYICDITSFPSGNIRRETELTVHDALKIVCDVSEPVDVHVGENVTIHCSTSRNAQYRWTKNNMLVSVNESLQLLMVTDSDSGVYTLTVSRGNESLHQHFTITVQIQTTSMSPGLTSSPPSYVSTEALTTETNIISTTSQTTGLQTTDAPVTRITSSFTDTTDDEFTSAGNVATNMSYTHDGVTSSPDTHTDPYNFNHSSSTQQTARDEPTNTTTSQTLRPNVSSNITKTTTPGAGAGVEESSRSHVVVLILVAALVLILVVGFLYRRHIITKRMSLPPPFKPPPPPVKFTAPPPRHKTFHQDISMQHFPISRCNSLTEMKIHGASFQ